MLSLYEVVEISPGRHCDLRDPEGETIRVFVRHPGLRAEASDRCIHCPVFTEYSGGSLQWIPAFAGMTMVILYKLDWQISRPDPKAVPSKICPRGFVRHPGSGAHYCPECLLKNTWKWRSSRIISLQLFRST